MADKKIYVKGIIGVNTFVGHMTEREANWTFEKFETLSKADYQAARGEGIRSYGEYVTMCRRNKQKPIARYNIW